MEWSLYLSIRLLRRKFSKEKSIAETEKFVVQKKNKRFVMI